MEWDKSTELIGRAGEVLAGGVSSGARRGDPLVFARAKDGHMWDVDGNEYIDFVMGRGPDLFGHAPQFIIDAVSRDIGKGLLFGGQFEQEIRVAEMVRDALPLKGLIRFGCSGTEVTMGAVRLARGFTGRPKYVKFEGHYHGWSDTVQYSHHSPLDQIGPPDAAVAVQGTRGMGPGTAQDIVTAPWNNLPALEKVFERHGDEIACAIMEPILCNTIVIPPKDGYLEGARDLCHKHGALFILDEVITGFRVALGGAQELYGVTADIATYAKAMGGGVPISMFVARPEIMKLVGDGVVDHGGTYNSNVVAMSALEAGLTHIMADSDAFYRNLNEKGERLREGLRDVARRTESDLLVQGVGSVFGNAFTARSEIVDYREFAQYCDMPKAIRFNQAMLERGIRLSSGTYRWHIASTHTDEDIEETIAAAYDVLRAI